MTTAGWFDSHCHVQTEDDVAGLLTRARTAGIAGMVAVGTDLASSDAALELAGREPDVVATVGLHPHEASRLTDEAPALRARAESRPAVAIGETGLDFHYDHSPRARQQDAFRAQIGWAHELGLPLVVHSRDAWEETFAALESEGVPDPTVLHCFTGGPDEARRAVALGAHVSFSGIVSFASAEAVRAAIDEVPLGRMLVETDSPYLAPVPHRGRPNEPAFLPDVGVAVASAAGIDVAAVRAATAANAAEIFRTRAT